MSGPILYRILYILMPMFQLFCEEVAGQNWKKFRHGKSYRPLLPVAEKALILLPVAEKKQR
jgi:hypothetical protein